MVDATNTWDPTAALQTSVIEPKSRVTGCLRSTFFAVKQPFTPEPYWWRRWQSMVLFWIILIPLILVLTLFLYIVLNPHQRPFGRRLPARGGSATIGSYSYTEQHKWPELCHEGEHQSPIDINTRNVHTIHSANRWHLTNYDRTVVNVTIENNVKTLIITMPANTTMADGAGLPGPYWLHSLHFHWAGSDDAGAEHTVDGHVYPMEGHYVHVRHGYTFEQALNTRDGLAVFGVHYEQSDRIRPEQDRQWQLISQNLPQLQKPKTASILSQFTPTSLLPSNRDSFYRYHGSLTGPPCVESIVWTVFREVVPVRRDTMAALRQLLNDKQKPIQNYRPVQAVNSRRVELWQVNQ